MIKRGQVRWYKFSRPDKKRPVVILTRDSALEFLGEITIAPITSIIRDIPTEVPLTEADGMPKQCVVNVDHIQTVSKEKRWHSVAFENERVYVFVAAGLSPLQIGVTVKNKAEKEMTFNVSKVYLKDA